MLEDNEQPLSEEVYMTEVKKRTIRHRVLWENVPYNPHLSSRWDDRVELT